MILSVLFSKYRTKSFVKDRHTDIRTDASKHTRHTHKCKHTHIHTHIDKNINTGTDLQDSLQASTNSLVQQTEDKRYREHEQRIQIWPLLSVK